MSTREIIKEKKRIVIKIGSSTLTHMATGNLNLIKMERFIRELCDLRNQGKDVVVVSSGAIAVGRKAVNLEKKEETLAKKTGMCSHWTGKAHDGISEDFWRIQPNNSPSIND